MENSITQSAATSHDEAPVAVMNAAPAQQQPPQVTVPGYSLIEKLGSGAYGEVWRAEAPGGLGKAVKIIHGSFDEKRAGDEWKSLLQIKAVRHPFLLSLERIEIVDNRLVVVTELADESLSDRFQRCLTSQLPGIPRNELLGYLRETADVLDYMTREHGLQHLDVKPENVLLVSGHVKVADFGLVKNIYGNAEATSIGLTPMFAAPECFDGQPSDRSDQYSLAIVYQQLLTGVRPFPGESLAELAAQHLTARPDLESLPESDRPIIERALSKDPFDRFENCRALIDRLLDNGSMAGLPGRVAAHSAAAASTARDNASPVSTKEKTDQIDVAAAAPASGTDVLDIQPASVPATPDGDRDAENAQSDESSKPSVAPESKGVSPTLFLGLGGCGSKTLNALVGRLDRRLGALDKIPSLSMLCIDTEAELQEWDEEDEARVEQRQLLQTPLKTTQYYRNADPRLTRWLRRRWIYNVPRSGQSSGIRPLGRLALVDHAEAIERRLREELASICAPTAIERSEQVFGRRMDATPRVFVVASASGGAGSGMVWDVLQLVHQVIKKRAGGDVQVICLLSHCTSSAEADVELGIVNSGACLCELHHYMNEGSPGDPSFHLQPLRRHHGLFENVYFINLGSDAEDEFDAAADVLACYLDANVARETAEFSTVCRQASAQDRNIGPLRTFAMESIDGERLLTADRAAQEQLARAIRRWLVPSEADAFEIADRIGDEAKISSDALLKQIQDLIQPHSQRLIESWLGQPGSEQGAGVARLLDSIDAAFPIESPHDRGGTSPETKSLTEQLTAFIGGRERDLFDRISRLVNEQRSISDMSNVCRRLAAALERTKHRSAQMAQGLTNELQQLQGQLARRSPNPGQAEVVEADLRKYFDLKQLLYALGWLQAAVDRLQARSRYCGSKLSAFQTALRPIAERSDDPLAATDDAEQQDPFFTEIGEVIQRQIHERFSRLSEMIFTEEPDVAAVTQTALATARQIALECLVDRQIDSLRSRLLACDGEFRYFVAANEELRRLGLVDAVCNRLPDDADVAIHEEPEITILCEGRDIPAAEVARTIAGERPELLGLIKHLMTRADVAWAPWE